MVLTLLYIKSLHNIFSLLQAYKVIGSKEIFLSGEYFFENKFQQCLELLLKVSEKR